MRTTFVIIKPKRDIYYFLHEAVRDPSRKTIILKWSLGSRHALHFDDFQEAQEFFKAHFRDGSEAYIFATEG